MTTKNVIVDMKAGPGAMPVAMLVQVASRYESKIYITEAEKKINAKSIMGMMALGLTNGTELLIAADGYDENDAIEAVEKFLNGKSEN